MKKLIFLLLMAVALVGFVSALDTVHPPGVLTLEAALPGYSADSRVVTPDTVLVLAMPVTAEPSSFQAVMALYNESAIQPNSGIIGTSGMSLIFRQTWVVYAETNYYLRC